MGVINRHVDTKGPNWGLGPHVLNVNGYWGGFPKASASNNVLTMSQQTQGSSATPGTQVDYPRNLNVVFAPVASSSIITTGGAVTVFGVDAFGSTRSESFGSSAGTNATGVNGSVNFARIDTISCKLSFLTGSSTAASNITVNVGVGPKIGLPVFIRSSGVSGANGPMVVSAYIGTVRQATFSGTNSTNNAFSVVTGPYWNGGVSMGNVLNSASFLAIEYMKLGFLAPRPTPPQDDRR